jgi:hypothetical protein
MCCVVSPSPRRRSVLPGAGAGSPRGAGAAYRGRQVLGGVGIYVTPTQTSVSTLPATNLITSSKGATTLATAVPLRASPCPLIGSEGCPRRGREVVPRGRHHERTAAA